MVRNHSNRSVGQGVSQVFLEVEPIDFGPPAPQQPELLITVDHRLELSVGSDRGVQLAVSFIAALDSVKAIQSGRPQFNFEKAGGTL